MPYYLTHPEHGTHICYTPEDVEAHKAIGWIESEVVQKTEKLHLPDRKKPGITPKVKHGD